jgi:hypothetical protein
MASKASAALYSSHAVARAGLWGQLQAGARRAGAGITPCRAAPWPGLAPRRFRLPRARARARRAPQLCAGRGRRGACWVLAAQQPPRLCRAGSGLTAGPRLCSACVSVCHVCVVGCVILVSVVRYAVWCGVWCVLCAVCCVLWCVCCVIHSINLAGCGRGRGGCGGPVVWCRRVVRAGRVWCFRRACGWCMQLVVAAAVCWRGAAVPCRAVPGL